MSDRSADTAPSERARVEALRALDLPRGARVAEVRRRYLELARALHPDLHPGDPERVRQFQRVAAAYELLRRYHRQQGQHPAGRRPSRELDEHWWSSFGHLV